MDHEVREKERRAQSRSYVDWCAWVVELARAEDPRGVTLDRLRRLSIRWYNAEIRRNLVGRPDTPRTRRLNEIASSRLQQLALKFRRELIVAEQLNIVPDVEVVDRASTSLVYCVDRCRIMPKERLSYGRSEGALRLGCERWSRRSVPCNYCDNTRLLREGVRIPGWTHRICVHCSVETGLTDFSVQQYFNYRNLGVELPAPRL